MSKKTLSEKRLERRHYTPVLNIRPSYSVLYTERLDKAKSTRTAAFNENTKNLAFNATGGQISKKAKKNIGTAIDWLLQAARPKKVIRSSTNSEFYFKINFVTLTLAATQEHTDQEIKSSILDPFLQILKERYSVNNYLWRAEAQINGNIHFHLITDQFVHYIELRDLWNKCQNKLGYIDRYEKKFNHRDPNSTDVHSVKNINNIAAYLSKYCCKNLCTVIVPSIDYSLKKKFRLKGLDTKNLFKKDSSDTKYFIHDITTDQEEFIKNENLKVIKPREITGRLWYLSKSLQGMKSLKIYLDEDNDLREEFDNMYKNVTFEMLKQFDYCTAVFFKISDYLNGAARTIGKKISEFLQPLINLNQPQTVYYV